MATPPDMNEIVKVAQQMQDRFKEAHEALLKARYTGKAGAGDITAAVTLNGRHQCLDVAISAAAAELTRAELSDLIRAAFNDANNKIENDSESRMVDLSKDLGIPFGEEEKDED